MHHSSPFSPFVATNDGVAANQMATQHESGNGIMQLDLAISATANAPRPIYWCCTPQSAINRIGKVDVAPEMQCHSRVIQ